MKGGVLLFRGTGAAARRYVEADRSRADEYYLGADNAVAEYTVIDARGEVTAARSLSADEYEGWVDWINPVTGESMGTPRKPGEVRKGSPLFAEMTINAPKSLSVAAALHPEVSEALDVAQQDAAGEIRRFLGRHSVTLAGPRGAQEVLPVEHMQTVAITHKTSRAGDPHRHIHFQIGTRVWAGGKWRALTTAALFKQQGAIRALGTAVIAAHTQLAQTLADHGLTLDPVSGEFAELEPFNQVMSKRSAQIRRKPGPHGRRVGGGASRRGGWPGTDGAVAGCGLGASAARQEAHHLEERAVVATRTRRRRLRPDPRTAAGGACLGIAG
ncbi:hypothetical protein GCM10027079_24730 [Sediminivirga luteola]